MDFRHWSMDIINKVVVQPNYSGAIQTGLILVIYIRRMET